MTHRYFLLALAGIALAPRAEAYPIVVNGTCVDDGCCFDDPDTTEDECALPPSACAESTAELGGFPFDFDLISYVAKISKYDVRDPIFVLEYTTQMIQGTRLAAEREFGMIYGDIAEIYYKADAFDARLGRQEEIITKLNESYYGANKEIYALNEKVGYLNTRIAGLESQIAAIAALPSIEKQLIAQAAKIAELESRVAP